MPKHHEIRAAIYDYYEHLSHLYTVDTVWEENGETFVQISPNRSAAEPPDSTVYRCWIGEMTIGGDGYGDRCCGLHDVEVLKQEEVEFINGAIGYGNADG